MQFATIWTLLALLAIPALIILKRRFGKSGSMRISTTSPISQLGSSLRLKLRRLPFILRLTVLALLAIAMARPREGIEKTIDKSRGIAIEMVVDRSSSMANPMIYNGRRATRLDAVKEIFKEFVLGGKDFKGRNNDLIGLIVFARYSDTIYPLTLEHKALADFIEKVDFAKTGNENGTAIGDALELAAARLQTAESELKKRKLLNKDNYKLKSKAIILLSDGEDNMSRTSIEQAAKLCKDWGIKVYTISLGYSDQQIKNLDGKRCLVDGWNRGHEVSQLIDISQYTGGKFFLARSSDELKERYEEINKLEKSEIETTRYMDFSEKFMNLAIAALIILLTETALRCTVLRTQP